MVADWCHSRTNIYLRLWETIGDPEKVDQEEVFGLPIGAKENEILIRDVHIRGQVIILTTTFSSFLFDLEL